MRLILASRNEHKLVELRALCGLPDECLLPATECPGAPDPDENADTFVGNALIKARALRDFSGEWALADDSGHEVDALGGAPGVRSARYAGAHGDDAANNALLLRNLDALGPRASRACHFSCALALVAPDGREFAALGQCPGTLLREGRGTNGFGYDPLFLPDGRDRTFAELPREVKCGFSHRAVAAARMRGVLRALFPDAFGKTAFPLYKPR